MYKQTIKNFFSIFLDSNTFWYLKYSVKEYLSVSKVAMRLKVISYLSFWSRSKNKNMLWPFWSKDWGPEFSIAQFKVTAYLKSNHILSFITCSSDQTQSLIYRFWHFRIKNAVCFDLLKADLLKKTKLWGCNWLFLTENLIYSSLSFCKLIFCKKTNRIEGLMISRDFTKNSNKGFGQIFGIFAGW